MFGVLHRHPVSARGSAPILLWAGSYLVPQRSHQNAPIKRTSPPASRLAPSQMAQAEMPLLQKVCSLGMPSRRAVAPVAMMTLCACTWEGGGGGTGASTCSAGPGASTASSWPAVSRRAARGTVASTTEHGLASAGGEGQGFRMARPFEACTGTLDRQGRAPRNCHAPWQRTSRSLERMTKGRCDRSRDSTSSVNSSVPHRSACSTGVWVGWWLLHVVLGLGMVVQQHTQHVVCQLKVLCRAQRPAPSATGWCHHPLLETHCAPQNTHAHLLPHPLHELWPSDALGEARVVLHLCAVCMCVCVCCLSRPRACRGLEGCTRAGAPTAWLWSVSKGCAV